MSGRGSEVGRPSHEFFSGEDAEKSGDCEREPEAKAEKSFAPGNEPLFAEAAKTAVGGLCEERQKQAGGKNPPTDKDGEDEQSV